MPCNNNIDLQRLRRGRANENQKASHTHIYIANEHGVQKARKKCVRLHSVCCVAAPRLVCGADNHDLWSDLSARRTRLVFVLCPAKRRTPGYGRGVAKRTIVCDCVMLCV